MSDGPRALLTPRERDVLRNPDEVDPATRRSLLGRVRNKLGDTLATDADIIRESGETELAQLMHTSVCEEEPSPLAERVDELQTELDAIRDEIDRAQDDETDGDGTDV